MSSAAQQKTCVHFAAGFHDGIIGWIQSESVAFVRHQCHKTSSLDRSRDGVLADRGATCFAAANNLAMSVGQLFQQLYVFVINVGRTRTLAIDEQRVLANGFRLELRFTSCVFSFLKCQGIDSTKGQKAVSGI